MTAEENISLGATEHMIELAEVRRAANLVGLDEALTSLPKGYATILSRTLHDEFDDEIGQIVVFETVGARLEGDPAWRIKRVVAVAGDRAPNWTENSLGATVPAGHLAVRGDNRRSETSEHLGYLPVESILGSAHPRHRLSRG